MTALITTQHAAIRMAQRGIPVRDADLIALIGTDMGDGYLVRAKDVQAMEQALKHLLAHIRRLIGKRIVVVGGRIVTAYHTTPRQQRRLHRRAPQGDCKQRRNPWMED
ncbi:MAG: hypothetical protein WBE01_13630 [Methyloceanibacter sp.]